MSELLSIARTDIPAEKDLLSFTDKAKGLASFIQSCPTPMTLAIQGGWGSGKSTMIQLVQNELNDDNVTSIKIETWKFAHIAAEEDIPAAFAAEVYQQLFRVSQKFKKDQIKKSVPDKVKRVLGAISPTVRKNTEKFLLDSGVKGSASSTLLSVAAGALFDLTEEAFQGQSELQKDFKEVFSETLESISGTKTFAIFVDDLDRLPPSRAVQIMETIKLFFETENCVFILAIDFDVVQKGARAIYGESMDEAKAKQFFDKIIQVPFNVPGPGDEVQHFIEELLNEIDENRNAGLGNFDKFAKVSETLLASNPRSIKRVVNSLNLLMLINSGGGDRSSESVPQEELLGIFWLLSLQTIDFKLANEIVNDLLFPDSPFLEECQTQKGNSRANGEDEEDASESIDNPWLKQIGGTGVTPFDSISQLVIADDLPLRDENIETLRRAAKLARSTAIETGSSGKTQMTDGTFEGARSSLESWYDNQGIELKSSAHVQIKQMGIKLEELPEFYKYFEVSSTSDRIRIKVHPDRKYSKELRAGTVFNIRITSSGKFLAYFNFPETIENRKSLVKAEQAKTSCLDEIIERTAQIEPSVIANLPNAPSQDGKQSIGENKIIATRNRGISADFETASVAANSNEADHVIEFMKAYLEFIIREIEGDPQKVS